MGGGATKDVVAPVAPSFSILFVRHGLSQNNLMKQIGSTGYTLDGCRLVKLPHHCNAPLTMPGREQALAVGELLGNQANERKLYTGAIFTSDMNRAIQTAGCLSLGWRRAQPHGPRSVRVLPFFSEMGGHNCIVRRQEVQEYLQSWGCDLDYGGFPTKQWASSQELSGDFDRSARQFRRHVLPWLRERVASNGQPAAVPVVVCHGRYIRYLLGMWSRLDNTQPVLAVYDAETDSFTGYQVLAPNFEMRQTPTNQALTRHDKQWLPSGSHRLLERSTPVHYKVYRPDTPVVL